MVGVGIVDRLDSLLWAQSHQRDLPSKMWRCYQLVSRRDGGFGLPGRRDIRVEFPE